MSTKPQSENLTWHDGEVSRDDRERLLRQRGCVVWLTGLSGSGKSTIARALEKRLLREGRICYVLDGDNVRHGLNADLGFSPEDRTENIRRIGEVAALLADAGLITITAFISPYRADRDRARQAVGTEHFVEVFLDTPLDLCERRDPKGLYRKARDGEIENFTGIDAPYEPPNEPDLVVQSDQRSVEQCAEDIATHLRSRGMLAAGDE